ncbi:MAG: alkaline phosphatase family protein [Sphingomonas sp.]|nr:alkaline phosphatase family protein [Sphingomonas sp.]
MRNLIAAAAAFGFATAATALPAAPPKLLIVISIDQYSSDLFDEYRGQFKGGLARIASGTAFRNGFQSHAATETCPGHATILTGVHPARSGIIANQWVDQSIGRPDKYVYCAEDERVAGSTSSKYTLSAEHLRVPTLGDLMKQRWPTSRNVAVAGKDRSAVMMSGHSADQTWYWDGTRFATSLDRAKAPASVAAINAALAKSIATAREPLTPTPFCAAKATPITVAEHAPVGNGAFARAAGDSKAFRNSPEADGAILALSAALIQEMKLGQGPSPDVIGIGLSATDYVGHYFGTEGQEMCLQLMSLDRDLGDFMRLLDSNRLDYAVVLTADHGGLDLPERARIKGNKDAQRVNPGLAAAEVGKGIAAKLGMTGPTLIGDVSGDIWIDDKVPAANRAKVLDEAIGRYRAHPQVEAVFTRDDIARTAMPTATPDKWSLIQRARASFDPQRSGDFYVILKYGVTPIGHATGAVATHGSPWDYDRRVPILFWRGLASPDPRDEAVETVDIMPTLAALLGIDIAPGQVDGKCLRGILNVVCPTR